MTKTIVRVGALCGVAVLLAGCGSNPNDVSYEAITGDLTPALQTSTKRPVDVNTNLAIMQDTNWRMFWDDLGRTFYTDRATNLTPYPHASLSGAAR